MRTKTEQERHTNGGPPRVGKQPGRPEAPDVPRAVEAVTGAFWGALSRMRGARFFHPDGVAYTATLTVARARREYTGVPLLERRRDYPAIVRFSRATGVPEPLPDILGIAISITDLYGRGRHQDFLLASSAGAPVARHALLPAPHGFFGNSFSSILAYRIGPKIRIVGAEPASEPERYRRGALAQLVDTAERGDLTYNLTLAPLAGRGEAVAKLVVGERLSDELAERIAFTPWNTGDAIRPVGPFMGLRRAAYRGSQRGRGLSESEIP